MANNYFIGYDIGDSVFHSCYNVFRIHENGIYECVDHKVIKDQKEFIKQIEKLKNQYGGARFEDFSSR